MKLDLAETFYQKKRFEGEPTREGAQFKRINQYVKKIKEKGVIQKERKLKTIIFLVQEKNVKKYR